MTEAKRESLAVTYDLDCTNWIKGIAILMVILSHLPGGPPTGGWGVELFLLCSGYGLARSYIRKGQLTGYWTSKWKKVWLPYAIVTGTVILLDSVVFSKRYAPVTCLLAVLGLDTHATVDCTMWYIPYLLCCYVIFYGAFRCFGAQPKKAIAVLTAGIGVLTVASFFVFDRSSGAWNYFTAYPAGVIAAYAADRFFWSGKTKTYLLIAGWCTLAAGILLLAGLDLQTMHMALRKVLRLMTDLLLSVGTILLAPFFTKRRVLAKWKLVGMISYELYLLEEVMITRGGSLWHRWDAMPVNLAAYFVMLFGMAIIVNRGIKRLSVKQNIGKLRERI